MMDVIINAKGNEEALAQMQDSFGGNITERWGEYTLAFDNDIAKSCIRCITFDWGVSLMEIDALFFQDILFTYDNKNSNPIHFSYCSQGYYDD